MKHISLKEQLREAMREKEALKAENKKLKADLEYIAMMTDVELEQEKEDAENVEI